MEIKSAIKARNGDVYDVEYYDAESYESAREKGAIHVCAFCFCDGKFLVVHDKDRKSWSPAGGGIDEGETIEEALVREIQEESNMKTIHHQIIGHQEIHEPHRLTVQTRSFCVVEPYGEFTCDPAGDVDEIRLIDPKDYKQYFNWGEVGDHIMNTALEMLEKYNKDKNK
jgi:ADP-ribose pyrophosphatase YjhB (NUDIX family)